MNPRSKEFKQLQKFWYDKLAKDGFVDIESSEDRLIQYDGYWLIRKDSKDRRDKNIEYYSKAADMINHPQFRYICTILTSKNRDKGINAKEAAKIWEMHANGISERDIASVIGFSKTAIHSLLEKFVKWMKVL